MQFLKYISSIFLFLTLFSFSQTTFGQDYKGSSDHPLMSRYQGSTIISYAQSNFESYPLFQDAYVNQQPVMVEGAFTSINYRAPKGRTPLEVHRNYEQALETKGFEQVLRLRNTDTWGFPDYIKVSGLPDEHRRGTTGTASESHYTAYQKGGISVAIYTSSYYGEATHTLVDIVENEEMEGEMVEVDADLIREKIMNEGRIALYGIYFDTGEATLQETSAQTLYEIVRFLQDNPSIQLYVVGHTDMTGGLASNVTLSQDRATAVVQYLTDQGIAYERLTPKGVGPLAPVDSNETEKGRAKNRRVELVLQLGKIQPFLMITSCNGLSLKGIGLTFCPRGTFQEISESRSHLPQQMLTKRPWQKYFLFPILNP
ncbi:MAG: OmpA family protein [Bacteroidota bacterium]